MPQPRPPYTYKPPTPAEVEVDTKATASETIRAVRIIIGRPKPPEIDGPDTPLLPRGPSEPFRRGRTT